MVAPAKSRWIVPVGLALGVAAGAWTARRCAQPRERAAGSAPGRGATADASVPRELRVPRAASAVSVDGEPDDAAWHDAARTGAFRTPAGAEARPFSEARFVWRGDRLYALLYAADEDIETKSDAFRLELGGRAFDVSPLGVVTGLGGVRAAHDVDGTPDDPKDDDEEWVIELEIPLAALGAEPRAGARIPAAVRRCDTPRGAPTVCAAWGEAPRATLVLE